MRNKPVHSCDKSYVIFLCNSQFNSDFLVREPSVEFVSGFELACKTRFLTVGFSEPGVEILNDLGS